MPLLVSWSEKEGLLCSGGRAPDDHWSDHANGRARDHTDGWAVLQVLAAAWGRTKAAKREFPKGETAEQVSRYPDKIPKPIFYICWGLPLQLLTSIKSLQIRRRGLTWYSLSRAGRASQDEDEIETEVLQAWATFATGEEVNFSSCTWNCYVFICFICAGLLAAVQSKQQLSHGAWFQWGAVEFLNS